MVKQDNKGEDCEWSTSNSLCEESEVIACETIGSMIEQVPKLTLAEKKQSYRVMHASKCTSRKWSQPETNRFYQLLAHYGLDFTLISYHPTFVSRRSQKELSNKYKKELRNNP